MTTCIKFVCQYSKDVHLECSYLGFTPTLRGFQPILGGWYTIVVDYVGSFICVISHQLRLPCGVIVTFAYVKPLEHDATCFTFLAKTLEASPKSIVVKFVERYGMTANQARRLDPLLPTFFQEVRDIGPIA
jgi:hypothetical protein